MKFNNKYQGRYWQQYSEILQQLTIQKSISLETTNNSTNDKISKTGHTTAKKIGLHLHVKRTNFSRLGTPFSKTT